MRHIAAYLLLQIGGNTSPSAADVKKVLSAVGIEADDERLDKLISELKGKDVNAVRPSFPLERQIDQNADNFPSFVFPLGCAL